MSSRVLVGLVLVAVSHPAAADDLPRRLAGELIRAEKANCGTSTSYGPRFVTARDVDGDKRKDVVLDYSNAWCGGDPAPYCDASGCLVKVYLGMANGAYRKVFDGRVQAWKIEDRADRPVLLLDGHPLDG